MDEQLWEAREASWSRKLALQRTISVVDWVGSDLLRTRAYRVHRARFLGAVFMKDLILGTKGLISVWPS
jgi:hypothetical protein